MRTLIRQNPVFFIYTLLLMAVGIATFWLFGQADMIIALNQQRTPFGDTAFLILTKAGEGYAYVAAALYYLIVERKKIIWISVTGLLVLLTSHFLKSWFGNDRPALFLKKAGLLEKVEFIQGADVLWGTTSFPSGHTMSAFALCTLICLWSKEKKIIPFLFCSAALLTGISRMYLLAHFQQDIVTGSIIGLSIGFLIYYFSVRD